MRVYDLSVPIRDGVDWYGETSCPPVQVRHVGNLATDGWRSHILSLMVLNGTTYLETAGHLYADAPTLDDIPLDRLVTRAFVIRVDGREQELEPPQADPEGLIPGQDAILLHSGWDAKLHAPDYYHASPYFSPALQEWLLARRPAILGGDMLSFDHPADQAMPFLRAFFRQGGMILCPLVGLGELPQRVILCVAPLRIAGANAAPCRVLAWEG